MFSLEMDAVQIMLKMMSAKLSIDFQKLITAKLTDDEWTSVSQLSDVLKKSKGIFIHDGGYVNIHQIRVKARKLQAQTGNIDLCVIDYIGLMSSTNSSLDRHLQVAEFHAV